MNDTFTEIKMLVNRALELDQLADRAREAKNEEIGRKIYEELLTILAPKADTLIERNDGNKAFAHYALGVILRVLNIYEDAIAEFKKSLEIIPNAPETLLEITLCLAKSGNLAAAEVYARKAVTVSSASASAWGNLAMVLIENGLKDEAFDAISKAVELDPHDTMNRYILKNFHRYFP